MAHRSNRLSALVTDALGRIVFDIAWAAWEMVIFGVRLQARR